MGKYPKIIKASCGTGGRGAVVSDEQYEGGISGYDDTEYYGGFLVAESMSEECRDRAIATWNACSAMPDPAKGVAALKECARLAANPSGAFSRDPLTHANNCIEALREAGRQALAACGEEVGGG